MTGFERLGAERLGDIHDLCRRALPDPPNKDELAMGLFDDDQPALVRGDPSVGVVATVRSGRQGYVRLLGVDPSLRRRGYGSTLLKAAETDLAGADSVQVGADAPYFLYPGVETTQTAMLCLLERHRYVRVEANFNMGVDLDALPEDPGGHMLATGTERHEVARWAKDHWPNWRAEVLRALDHSTLVIGRDERGITGICAYDVNRGGSVGPVAVRPDLWAKGSGRPLLLGALHRMRRTGRPHAEVVWVGPIFPYARVGGHVSRVFFVYRKDLR